MNRTKPAQISVGKESDQTGPVRVSSFLKINKCNWVLKVSFKLELSFSMKVLVQSDSALYFCVVTECEFKRGGTFGIYIYIYTYVLQLRHAK